MEIDWSKVPEGFPLWLEGTNEDHRKHSGWYRDAGQVFEGSHGGQWRACREGQFFTIHRKPAPAAWSGEGLPPVSYLARRLSYDESSGILTWLPRDASEFSRKHQYASWLSRCEGKSAGVEVKKKHKRYLRVAIGPEKIYAHRIAWAIYHGDYPEGEVDHINGNSMDNSISNLCIVSRQENCRNVRLHIKSKSGYCGVNWHEETGKWRARVKINGNEKYIGLFDDPQEAALRIKTVRDSLGFHENHGSPIRTPEQIAADERNQGIDAILEAYTYTVGPCTHKLTHSQAMRLYDAGIRKVSS